MFQEKIAEVETMIAKYKDALERMDHMADLTASKLVGDQHRVLRNFVRIAQSEEKIELSSHAQYLLQAKETYAKFIGVDSLKS